MDERIVFCGKAFFSARHVSVAMRWSSPFVQLHPVDRPPFQAYRSRRVSANTHIVLIAAPAE